MRPNREVELHRHTTNRTRDESALPGFRERVVPSWKVICALIAVCCAISLEPAAAQTDRVVSQIERSGDEQALSQIDELLRADPGDPESLLLKGVLLTRMGRDNEAKAVFLSLIQEHPELPEPYNNLAALYGATGDYEQAIEVLKLALRTHPSYEIVYENLTRVYGRLAGLAYDRALGVKPENPAEPVTLDLLDVVGHRLETTPSRVAADRASERSGGAPSQSAAQPPARPAVNPPAQSSAPPPAPPVVATSPEPESPPTKAESVAEPEPDFSLASETIHAWAGAWSSQDVEGYLGFYSTRFSPPDGLSRDAWARQRRERISRPSFIAVSVEQEIVERAGVETVRVRFRQSYRSDNYQDVVEKVLDLIWEEDGWRIVAERVVRGAA